MTESIPALAREVIQLFGDRLADHRFGELDGEALAELAQHAEARSLDVAKARLSLDAAQDELERAKAALSKRAEQALAYARIHGADDPAVAEAVAQIDAAHATKKAPGRRRRRSTKKAAPPTDAAELPFGASSARADEAQAGAA